MEKADFSGCICTLSGHMSIFPTLFSTCIYQQKVPQTHLRETLAFTMRPQYKGDDCNETERKILKRRENTERN